MFLTANLCRAVCVLRSIKCTSLTSSATGEEEEEEEEEVASVLGCLELGRLGGLPAADSGEIISSPTSLRDWQCLLTTIVLC